ncbi:hypothetical protein RPAAT24_1217 [Rickettsia parkeri str. AT|nr:hypothetical protein RPAAT24_1217 [Rickettsia parkeri str. AT\
MIEISSLVFINFFESSLQGKIENVDEAISGVYILFYKIVVLRFCLSFQFILLI